MRKSQRFAFLAIGGLGLLAAIAPGLAANLTVPEDGAVPAAGQGAVTVQGFTVTSIDWTVDETTERVTSVRFDIKRSAEAAADVTSQVDELGGNAVVRVRLESASHEAEWTSCATTGTPARATCTLLADGTEANGITGGQMKAADLEKVNIIAFDRN